MNKRSNESRMPGAEPQESCNVGGRLPRRVGRSASLMGSPVRAQRNARRLRWRQGPLAASMAVPRWASAQDDELPSSTNDSALSGLEPDLTVETLLDLVDHVMRGLPRDGDNAVPGLEDDLPDVPQPCDDAPLPERLRRVESILRSLAQVLLATV